MIESCTKRRMIISIVALGVITVIILILEEKLTSASQYQSPTPVPVSQSDGGGVNSALGEDLYLIKRSSSSVPTLNQDQIKSFENCWATEDYKIVAECAPCTHFEITSGSIPACKPTGLKETIHCNTSGAVFRSCSVVPSIARTRFWIFESLMLLTAVLSYGFSRYRTSLIERATIKQIERRLASGM